MHTITLSGLSPEDIRKPKCAGAIKKAQRYQQAIPLRSRMLHTLSASQRINQHFPINNRPMPSFEKFGIIIVTYHPDMSVLENQLKQLPQDAHKIIVDNTASKSIFPSLQKLALDTPNCASLYNKENIGLAAALNQGAGALALQFPEIEMILLLDQDSEPHPGSIETLVSEFKKLAAQKINVGAVGPQLFDPDTQMMHGFHRMTSWRWKRVHPSISANPIAITNVNGSGTLMPLKVFNKLGGLDERLFIDHIDTEWSFRLINAGYSIYGIPKAIFTHRMGEQGIRIWLFGWRVWPSRSAQRHCYLFRNTLWLMRRPYVPNTWKFWAAIKLLLTTTLHGIFDSDRKKQLLSIKKGVVAGLHPPGSST